MKKKIKNYTCAELNCIDCPLRMLRCYGYHHYNKKISEVWKGYIAERAALHKLDKEFIEFFKRKLDEEKEM